MKRASYRHAVEAIALNDEPCEAEVEAVMGLASVVIIAALFDVSAERLARDVVRYRATADRENERG
jgi:hypothetical protein